MNSEKKWYYVSNTAECSSDGYVRLTEEEAKIVAYATNESNWEGGKQESFSGHFFIDVEHPRDKI